MTAVKVTTDCAMVKLDKGKREIVFVAFMEL